jgi:hypothetical protein
MLEGLKTERGIMMTKRLIACLLLVLCPFTLRATDLAKPYALVLGEIVELQCGIHGDLRTFSSEGLLGSDYRVTVSYDKTKDSICLTFIGDQDSIDNAKSFLSLINDQVIPKVISFAQGKYGASLSKANFVIVYIYSRTGREILSMQDGVFNLPR